MDPVTLIMTALAAGAAAGLKDTVSGAVRDGYAGLKALASRRLAGRRDGEVVLARYGESPETWDKPLAAELAAAGAESDEELVAAAQAVLALTDPAGASAGRYTVTVTGSQGVQVGDHNQQHNTFNSPPGS